LGEGRVLEEIKIVLKGEALDPEGVIFQVKKIVRRLKGYDAHPVERKEQEDGKKRQWQIEG
jgi:hypothetical protein